MKREREKKTIYFSQQNVSTIEYRKMLIKKIWEKPLTFFFIIIVADTAELDSAVSLTPWRVLHMRILVYSAVDPHLFFADPDPVVVLNADPDPA